MTIQVTAAAACHDITIYEKVTEREISREEGDMLMNIDDLGALISGSAPRARRA